MVYGFDTERTGAKPGENREGFTALAPHLRRVGVALFGGQLKLDREIRRLGLAFVQQAIYKEQRRRYIEAQAQLREQYLAAPGGARLATTTSESSADLHLEPDHLVGHLNHTRTTEEGERTRTTALSLRNDEDGLQLAATRAEEVSTPTDEVASHTTAKLEKGRASVGWDRAATHRHDDGSSDGYKRQQELGVSADGADLSFERSRQATPFSTQIFRP